MLKWANPELVPLSAEETENFIAKMWSDLQAKQVLSIEGPFNAARIDIRPPETTSGYRITAIVVKEKMT